jgi:ribonuclease P protein component
MTLYRLKKNWDFRRVYRHGRTVVTRNIVLYYCPNGLIYNRIGFAVSKKVGKSVVRNRIKRVYREALKMLEGKMRQGYDMVIIARKPAVDIEFKRAQKELYYLCRKGKIIILEE